MKRYNDAVLAHVGDQRPSLENMIKLRRESIGAAPLYYLFEYAHDIHISDEVQAHPIIQELEILGMDIVFMWVLVVTN